MRLKQITPPAAEPILLADVKTYLRITGSDHDTELARMITGARVWAERFMARSLITQGWRMVMPSWPERTLTNWNQAIYLPRGLVQSLDTLDYVDTDGATQDFTGSVQTDFTSDDYGIVMPAYDVSWPDVRVVLNAVTVEWTSGYGNAGTDCPGDIIDALFFRVADLFEHRGQQDVKGDLSAAEHMLTPYRLEWL